MLKLLSATMKISAILSVECSYRFDYYWKFILKIYIHPIIYLWHGRRESVAGSAAIVLRNHIRQEHWIQETTIFTTLWSPCVLTMKTPKLQSYVCASLHICWQRNKSYIISGNNWFIIQQIQCGINRQGLRFAANTTIDQIACDGFQIR